jgi:hypothetical protein
MVEVATRRPGRVTFIGVLLYIYAVMAAAAAVTLIGTSRVDRIQEETGLTSTDLVWSGVWEAVVAIVLFLVAAAVMQGTPWARLLVAIVVGIRMAGAVVLLLLHHSGGYVINALWIILVGALILWALYSEESEEYFSGLER